MLRLFGIVQPDHLPERTRDDLIELVIYIRVDLREVGDNRIADQFDSLEIGLSNEKSTSSKRFP